MKMHLTSLEEIIRQVSTRSNNPSHKWFKIRLVKARQIIRSGYQDRRMYGLIVFLQNNIYVYKIFLKLFVTMVDSLTFLNGAQAH